MRVTMRTRTMMARPVRMVRSGLRRRFLSTRKNSRGLTAMKITPSTKGRVYRILVGEARGHVVRQAHQPQFLGIARRVFAAHHATHRPEVVLRAHVVTRLWGFRGSCHLRNPSVPFDSLGGR